jgi:catechol 2,3-dioxygenase-like lactoylglutathione lyase family enzyme
LSAITHLFAGVPVADLDTSIDWYTRFFGRPPDSRVGEEVLWEIDERAWLFIEPNAARAGAGRITLAVAGLDALLERLRCRAHRARTDRDLLERRTPRERPRSGREHDRVRRAARRRERVTSIGRNRGFAIDD